MSKCKTCGHDSGSRIPGAGFLIYKYHPYRLKYYCSVPCGDRGVCIVQRNVWLLPEHFLDDDLWTMKVREVEISHGSDPFFRRFWESGFRPTMEIGI